MDERMQVICKDCNKPFSISAKEQEWLKSRGLALFKRCKDCRAKRKQQNKEN